MDIKKYKIILSISTRLVYLLKYSMITLIILLTWPLFSVQADSPTIRLGYWDGSYQCEGYALKGRVYAYSDIYDLDTFTRDAMVGEVYSDYHIEALKANAVMIRSVGEYYHRHPQGNISTICNTTGREYNLRTSIVAGWQHGYGATNRGRDNNAPNDRVTDTGSQVIFQNQQRLSFQIGFNRCLQNQINALIEASSNPNYVTLLTDANNGIYNGSYCGYSAQSGLSVNSAYAFQNSLTNGTSPRSVSGSSQTSYVSPVLWPPRQAEFYWGHSGIDRVLYRPFNQSGFYMAGWHRGDKVEYRMNFGGIYENLHLIGIADIPGPVTLNIYIDGYFKRTIQWTENDNRRHLRAEKIQNIPYGDHAIAIEFANDYCVCNPYSANTDLNFYFDVMGVNDGYLHPRAIEDLSPFFSPHNLYMPLMLK